MLEYFEIRSLFGLYSYHLDFRNQEGWPLKFITGPNGYGKTTILSLINSLYTGQLHEFFSVPFDYMEFGFTDETMTFRQVYSYDSQKGTDDDTMRIPEKLEVTLQNGTEQSISFFLYGNDEGNEPLLKMYLYSKSGYYIKDQRLVRKISDLDKYQSEDVPAVDDNAEDLGRRLTAVSNQINETLQSMLFSSNGISDGEITQDDYNIRRECILRDASVLKKFGILHDNFTVFEYNSRSSAFLKTYIETIERAFADAEDFVAKLVTFSDTITDYGFADKDMEIHPGYGYRFRMKNDDKTILLPERLSSGEQHILILTYELIFKAQDDSLVLIDEPEMSFHMIWQLEFLKAIKKIMMIRHSRIQCIVATHSPQIFDSRWDMTVDLYEQSQKNREA